MILVAFKLLQIVDKVLAEILYRTQMEMVHFF